MKSQIQELEEMIKKDGKVEGNYYNSVNLKLGYSQIEIRSPKDIIEYEAGK